MILCVNLNAAIDKTIIVDGFQLGAIHRPEAVKSLAGGKGCNVARALKQFGEKPVVTGWVGGAAGQFIENGLQAEGIATDFVYTGFESRTCTSYFGQPQSSHDGNL
ncbi:MAG: PfkB family carbohydrate kinase [Chloroflexi bacterium]|nr:PfkB family carbohydrate kinase [Chloroflexota bacterium]